MAVTNAYLAYNHFTLFSDTQSVYTRRRHYKWFAAGKKWNAWFVGSAVQTQTHTHNMQFLPPFLGKNWLAGCIYIFFLHFFQICAFSWNKTEFHILVETIHHIFLGRLCLVPSSSVIVLCLIQSASSLHSTCPNHHNLPINLITKLIGSCPNNSLSSAFLFLFKKNRIAV